MDWQSAYDQAIVHNKERNKKIIELIKENDIPTLVLVKIIEHGEELQNLIPGSIFVNGKDTSPKERMRVIEAFEKGEIKVLISSNIFNEGVSITNIHMLIIASAMKGYTETSQKLGRSLRIGEGKKTALVFHFYDAGNRFTEKHSKRRASIYKKNGFKVSVEK
jgi:superfamily II DNA or RNA helicase